MKSISSAPGKIILFGEHFIVYEGKAVLCSIDKRITVESELTDSGKIEITSSLGQAVLARDQLISDAGSALKPVAYLARRMLSEFNSGSGIRVSIHSEFPSGVGLGSSSACCVAAASSISGLFSSRTREQVLELAIDAERTIFENTSGADCSVCTFGGTIAYHKNGQISRLEFEPKFSFVVANSRMPHSTSEVVSQVRKYKNENPAIFSLLCRQEERLIDDSIDALMGGDVRTLGMRMSQNQKYLEQIGVSNETLGQMLSVARETSYGAKITGAGGGGCIVAIVDHTNIDATIKKLGDAGYECFATKIDGTGLQHRTQ